MGIENKVPNLILFRSIQILNKEMIFKFKNKCVDTFTRKWSRNKKDLENILFKIGIQHEGTSECSEN